MGTYMLSAGDDGLAALVERVIAGETVTILRDGTAVAELRAPSQSAAGPHPASAAELSEHDKSHPAVDAASAAMLREFNQDEEE